jgi:hypothetical protein
MFLHILWLDFWVGTENTSQTFQKLETWILSAIGALLSASLENSWSLEALARWQPVAMVVHATGSSLTMCHTVWPVCISGDMWDFSTLASLLPYHSAPLGTYNPHQGQDGSCLPLFLRDQSETYWPPPRRIDIALSTLSWRKLQRVGLLGTKKSCLPIVSTVLIPTHSNEFPATVVLLDMG